METQIDLKELIGELAAETKFNQRLLEKDYHLTRILHQITERQIPHLVFKGGTCLNKCYLGFYRLSEDLDFVYNQEVKDLSKTQIRKIIGQLKREIFAVLDSLGFETSKELGKGWKMLTSSQPPKIIGLEIIMHYNSLLKDSSEPIKIEVSFRKKLIKPTRKKTIKHSFYSSLGEPVLPENLALEVIDLKENFAEKIRALISRKRMAVRDLYDLYFILKNKIIKIDSGIIDLTIAKIKESRPFTHTELIDFMDNLPLKINDLNEKEIESVIKTDEEIKVKEIAQLIKEKFAYLKQLKE